MKSNVTSFTKYKSKKMTVSICLTVCLLVCNSYAWNSLEAEIKSLYRDLDQLESDLHDVRAELHLRERRKLANNATWSGFTTAVAPGTEEFVAEGSVITFSSVRVNEGICPCNLEGECLDPLFGFFLCPETALYYFLISLVSPSDHVNNVYLRVDTQPMIYMMTPVDITAQMNSGSTQTGLVMQCQQGAKVSVVASANLYNENYVRLVPGTLSSFTGFRI